MIPHWQIVAEAMLDIENSEDFPSDLYTRLDKIDRMVKNRPRHPSDEIGGLVSSQVIALVIEQYQRDEDE